MFDFGKLSGSTFLFAFPFSSYSRHRLHVVSKDSTRGWTCGRPRRRINGRKRRGPSVERYHWQKLLQAVQIKNAIIFSIFFCLRVQMQGPPPQAGQLQPKLLLIGDSGMCNALLLLLLLSTTLTLRPGGHQNMQVWARLASSCALLMTTSALRSPPPSGTLTLSRGALWCVLSQSCCQDRFQAQVDEDRRARTAAANMGHRRTRCSLRVPTFAR